MKKTTITTESTPKTQQFGKDVVSAYKGFCAAYQEHLVLEEQKFEEDSDKLREKLVHAIKCRSFSSSQDEITIDVEDFEDKVVKRIVEELTEQGIKVNAPRVVVDDYPYPIWGFKTIIINTESIKALLKKDASPKNDQNRFFNSPQTVSPSVDEQVKRWKCE